MIRGDKGEEGLSILNMALRSTLTSASIKDKAHKWLGQLSSVGDAKDKFKVYFLVGEPSQSDLSDAAMSAVNILKKSQLTSVVYTEQETEKLAELIEQEVKNHETSLTT